MSIRGWVQATSDKRVKFGWTYSGWSELYMPAILICAIAMVWFPRILSWYSILFLFCLCVTPFIDVVTVAIIDSRKRGRPR